MDVASRRAVDNARRQAGLPFTGLLTEDRILEAFGSPTQRMDVKWLDFRVS